MERMGKYLSLTLVVVLVLPIPLLVNPTTAQSIPKPSVPQFNLRYANNIDNQSIEIIIFDQLPAHYAIDNFTALLWYNIQWKSHTDNMWHTYSSDYAYNGKQLISASNSYVSSEPVSNDSINYNTFTTNVTYFLGYSYNGLTIDNFSAGQKVDFEVKAVFGYYVLENYKTDYYAFFYNESDWSPTQTITIPTSNNSNPSPTVPELSWLTILPLLLSIPMVLVIVRKKLHSGKSLNI